MSAQLFTPYRLSSLPLDNRLVVAPMCQYVAENGSATDWHLMHLGQLALGGFGLLTVEATHVSPEGRITPGCLGLWSDENARALDRVLRFCRQYGTAKVAIQLSHAGRKGSSHVPLRGGAPLGPDEGAWQTVAPSAIPGREDAPPPLALDATGLHKVRRDFVAAAQRAWRLGFDAVELHMAHGYLLHQFLSPLSNRREDGYGGSLENRMRFPLEVFSAVREAWTAERPLGVRVSATDWMEGGWTVDETVVLAAALKDKGCDFIDVSSGGLHPQQRVEVKPLYQVPFARRVKEEVGITTMAVGMIRTVEDAESVIADGSADLVALARAAMDDPHWGWHAAAELGCEIDYPPQYVRAHPRRWQTGSAQLQR